MGTTSFSCIFLQSLVSDKNKQVAVGHSIVHASRPRDGYLSGVGCRVAYGPDDAIATHCLFASVKSISVLPLWYWLTWVVPDKWLLNAGVCV